MRKNSISEIVFSLMLFLMFVIGGFLMISYSGNIYKNIIEDGQSRENTQIPLAYITEKLYQAKSKDYVSIENVDGTNVLIIDNESYITCIYIDNNYLKELTISDISKFNKNAGNSIYKIDDLNMIYKDNLYVFEIENEGSKDSVSLSLR